MADMLLQLWLNLRQRAYKLYRFKVILQRDEDD